MESLMGQCPSETDVISAKLWGKESSRLKKLYFRWRFGRKVKASQHDIVRAKYEVEKWARSPTGGGYDMTGVVVWRNPKGHTISLWRAGEGCRWKLSYLGNYESCAVAAFGGYDVSCTLSMASLQEALNLLRR